ncbi:MAG: hypothetical protein ACN4GZ_17705, partial [Acidimicrobiales bacterium]
RRAHLYGILATLATAGLWLVLAWRSPNLTHHFAPAVAAGSWGFLARRSMPAASNQDRLLMAGGALSITLAVYLVLLFNDRLQGPSLIASVPPSVELPAMAVAGAVVGSGLWCLLKSGPTQPSSTAAAD